MDGSRLWKLIDNICLQNYWSICARIYTQRHAWLKGSKICGRGNLLPSVFLKIISRHFVSLKRLNPIDSSINQLKHLHINQGTDFKFPFKYSLIQMPIGIASLTTYLCFCSTLLSPSHSSHWEGCNPDTLKDGKKGSRWLVTWSGTERALDFPFLVCAHYTTDLPPLPCSQCKNGEGCRHFIWDRQEVGSEDQLLLRGQHSSCLIWWADRSTASYGPLSHHSMQQKYGLYW